MSAANAAELVIVAAHVAALVACARVDDPDHARPEAPQPVR